MPVPLGLYLLARREHGPDANLQLYSAKDAEHSRSKLLDYRKQMAVGRSEEW